MEKKKGKQLKRNESMSPEEIMARSAKARFRFRALVRFVIRNLYWLEDCEDQQLGEDIQKNILLLTKKKEKKSLLSLQEKAILNKPAEERTEEERLHLSRIIGGLKCFRRYPAHVKSELAGVSYFFYFGPGRTVVRQGDESNSLYFVITGEVTVSQESFDPVLNRRVRQDIATMGPGSMFGEVALLHDIPRTATIVTNTHVELLCLKKKDFDIILKATVQQQWQDVQNAMGTFTYFEDWDDIAIRECCILSKMKVYVPDQTVLGDGVGLRDYVYFILKGKCRVIEHLLVTSRVKDDKKYYKLYTPPPADTVAGNTKDEEIVSSQHSIRVERESKDIVRVFTDDARIIEMDEATRISPTLSKIESHVSKFTMRSIDNSVHPLVGAKKSAMSYREISKKPSITLPGNALSYRTAPKKSEIDLPPEVETHFMQICFFNTTACFGLGENMHHRRIVAATYTECLLIPRYWLLQKNKGNIWSRVQQYLNNHIPTTQQVFKEFVTQRRWLAHRKKMASEIMSRRKLTNDNSITNVPYFVRIHEEIDI